MKAHLCILNNTVEVAPYIQAHLDYLNLLYPGAKKKWLVDKHKDTFIDWFKNEISQRYDTASSTLRLLAGGPDLTVITYRSYDINHYRFSTKEKDDKSSTQNSGVVIIAEATHFSSSRDVNPLVASHSYFGVIDEIWEVRYIDLYVPIFKCKWVNISTGVRKDDGFTLVNLNRLGSHDDPFIMASQAKQIFYVSDPVDNNWSVVVPGKPMAPIDELPYMTPILPNSRPPIDDSGVDREYATRLDHREGIYIQNDTVS